MNEEFLQDLKSLINSTRPNFATSYSLEFKNVFGAVGGYVNDRLFITRGRFGVALKLPRGVLDSLFENDDVEQLKYFPKGHIKKEYAVIPERIYGDAIEFGILMDKSIEYVTSV